MSLTANATVPPFPYSGSFAANWQTQSPEHLVIKLSLNPGTYQLSVLPDLMAITTAVGAATADDVTEFVEEVLISSARVVRTVNWSDANGKLYGGENQIASLLSNPDTLATQLMADAGLTSNYGAFDYYTNTVTIEPAKTITYLSGAKDFYTADYYLLIDGWNVSFPQMPSGTDVVMSGRFLVTTGNPTGQRSIAWGSDWLNVQSWYEFYQPPVVAPAVDLDPQNLPATVSFANTVDAHGVETPPIASSADSTWWHDFGANVLLGYSSQALSALRQLADASGLYRIGAALDVVNAATNAVGVSDFLNGVVAKIWAHDAQGMQLVLNSGTTPSQVYDWIGQGDQIAQDAQRGATNQAWSNVLDRLIPGGGMVFGTYTSVPQVVSQTNSFSLALLVPGLQINGSEKSDVVSGGTDADGMQLGAGDDVAMGYAGNDVIATADGRDWLCGGTGDDLLDGGAGIDEAAYYRGRSDYQISKLDAGWVVQDRVGSEGSDTLSNIERLHFSDSCIALDVSATESAGQTQLLLGAVLGKNLLAGKPAVIGAVIDLFDQGYTMQQLAGAVMRLPIWSDLTGQATPTNTDIANYLLWRVNGATPDAAILATAVNALDAQYDIGHAQGDFLWQLAQSSANQAQVGLLGLATTGLAYTTV